MFTLQTAHTASYINICKLALNSYPLEHQYTLQSQHKRVGEYCISNASFLYQILFIFVILALTFTFNKHAHKMKPLFSS